jgi:hypothetical protein
MPEIVYQLNDEQRRIIEESREQIKNNQTLTNECADKEIDK